MEDNQLKEIRKGCMAYIPPEIKELIHKYMETYNKRPEPFNYDEWNNFGEYKKYLEKELRESTYQ